MRFLVRTTLLALSLTYAANWMFFRNGDSGEVRLPTPVIEAVSQTNMFPWDEALGRLALASILPRSLIET